MFARRRSSLSLDKLPCLNIAFLTCCLFVIGHASPMSLDRLERQYQQQNDKQLDFSEFMLPEAESEVLQNEIELVPAIDGNSEMYLLVPAAPVSQEQYLQSLTDLNESENSGNVESNSDMLMLESEDTPAMQILELPKDVLENKIVEDLVNNYNLGEEFQLSSENKEHTSNEEEQVSGSMLNTIADAVKEIENEIETELVGNDEILKEEENVEAENVKQEEEKMSIEELPMEHKDTETENTDSSEQEQVAEMKNKAEALENSEQEMIGVVMEESNDKPAVMPVEEEQQETEQVNEASEMDLQADKSEFQPAIIEMTNESQEQIAQENAYKIEETQSDKDFVVIESAETMAEAEEQPALAESFNNESSQVNKDLQIVEKDDENTAPANARVQADDEIQVPVMEKSQYFDKTQTVGHSQPVKETVKQSQAFEETQADDKTQIAEESLVVYEIKPLHEEILATNEETATKVEEVQDEETQDNVAQAEEIQAAETHGEETEADEETHVAVGNNIEAIKHKTKASSIETQTAEEVKPSEDIEPMRDESLEEIQFVENSQNVEEVQASKEVHSLEESMNTEAVNEEQAAEKIQHVESTPMSKDSLSADETDKVEDAQLTSESQPVDESHKAEEEIKLAEETQVSEEILKQQQGMENAQVMQEAQATEESQTMDETQTLEEVQPVKETQTVKKILSGEKFKNVKNVQPFEDIQPDTEAQIVEEIQPVEDVQPVEGDQTVKEVQHNDKTNAVEEVQSVEEAQQEEETEAVVETQPVKELKNDEETQAAEEAQLVAEHLPVESVEQTQFAEEAQSNHKTQSDKDAQPVENDVQIVEEIQEAQPVKTLADAELSAEEEENKPVGEIQQDETKIQSEAEDLKPAETMPTIVEDLKLVEKTQFPNAEAPSVEMDSLAEEIKSVEKIQSMEASPEVEQAESVEVAMEEQESEKTEAEPVQILADELPAEELNKQEEIETAAQPEVLADEDTLQNVEPVGEIENEKEQESPVEVQKPFEHKETDNILNYATNESEHIKENTSMLTTIVQVPTKEELTQQQQPQQEQHEQVQEQQPAVIEIDSSTTLKPLNVVDSVLNYVNASFMNQMSNDNIKQEVKPEQVFSSKLRRYDGAQVWRIVVQNDREKKLADELQTKYGGQLWKEVKQEVDYLLKPQVLADAERHVRAANLSRIVLIDNLQKVIEVENPPAEEIAQLQNRKGHRLTWQAYHRLEDIHGYFDYMAKTYPDICTVETIGYSLEKRPLKILKISNGNANNTGIWIDGGMHAREWISPAVVTYVTNQIVEGWDDLPSYMRNVNWYIHAVANPDGYEYSHTTDRLWRKNMRSHGRACPGVDLNRNFGYKWGGKGTSANPCSQTYRGSKAFSEPETFYISKFISNFPRETFKAYLSFHSYGQFILYPWGYDYHVTKDMADLDLVARQAGTIITKSTGVKYTVGSSANTLYPAAGGSDDWAKGIAGIKYAYTIEMGDTGRYGFVLPAEHIEPNGKNGLIFVETVAKAITMGKNGRRRKLKAQKTH